MSLSPEAIEIDTPPDSPVRWESESSDSSNEYAVASPKKRPRKPGGRTSAKRPRLNLDHIEAAAENLQEQPPLRQEEDDNSIRRDCPQFHLFYLLMLQFLESDSGETHEIDGEDRDLDGPDEQLKFYGGAVEGGIAQFYALRESQSLFLVRGWDTGRRCPTVRNLSVKCKAICVDRKLRLSCIGIIFIVFLLDMMLSLLALAHTKDLGLAYTNSTLNRRQDRSGFQ